jgi:surfeit locus 1 family protein
MSHRFMIRNQQRGITLWRQLSTRHYWRQYSVNNTTDKGRNSSFVPFSFSTQDNQDPSEDNPFQRKRTEHGDKNINRKLLYALVLSAITLTLGIWQTRRYMWKKELISSRREKLANEEPIVLNNISPELDREDFYYRRVILEGKWLNEYTVLIGTRPSPITKRMQINSRSTEIGYYIVTPFACSDNGAIVFVNRGWIPQSELEHLEQYIQDKASSSTEKIIAIVREYEHPTHIRQSEYRTRTIGNRDVFIVMDPSVIARELNVKNCGDEPLLLEEMATDASSSSYPLKAIPDDFLKFYVMPETHIAYMTVWYGLTAWILGAMYYMKYKRR